MNFFRTTDTTDTTIWKPGLRPVALLLSEIFNIQTYFSKNKIDKLVRKLGYLRKKFAPIGCPPPPPPAKKETNNNNKSKNSTFMKKKKKKKRHNQ